RSWRAAWRAPEESADSTRVPPPPAASRPCHHFRVCLVQHIGGGPTAAPVPRRRLEKEQYMKVNMGPTDRKIRAFVVAPVLIILAIIVGAGSVGGIILLALAAIMLATAAMKSCPLYLPFGLNTCKVKSAKG
ncbi:MAG: DUF2892 domain-containing protein, partial [Ilumatobacter sp.]|nr:DUF2892 domain-containing protein [Ilumatobacter sp.]